MSLFGGSPVLPELTAILAEVRQGLGDELCERTFLLESVERRLAALLPGTSAEVGNRACTSCPSVPAGEPAQSADVWRVLSVARFEAERAATQARELTAADVPADRARTALMWLVSMRWSQVAEAIDGGLFERLDAEESEEAWRQEGMATCFEPDPDLGRDLDYDDGQDLEDVYDDAGEEFEFWDASDEDEGEF